MKATFLKLFGQKWTPISLIIIFIGVITYVGLYLQQRPNPVDLDKLKYQRTASKPALVEKEDNQAPRLRDNAGVSSSSAFQKDKDTHLAIADHKAVIDGDKDISQVCVKFSQILAEVDNPTLRSYVSIKPEEDYAV
jgi:hypothetical protein